MIPENFTSSRTIRFSNKTSVGWIDIKPWKLRNKPIRAEEVDLDVSWQRLGSAQGEVEIPVGMIVRLRFNPNARLDNLHLLDANSIQELSLERTRIEDDELQHITHLKGLHSLDLSSSTITQRGFSHLEALESLEHLAWSNIQGSTWRSASFPNEGIKSIARLPRLRSLKLSAWGITGTEIMDISALTKLVNLDLFNFNLRDEICWRDLARLQNLKSLRLTDGFINDGAMKYLSTLLSLETLDLSRSNFVEGKGLKYLGNLKNLKKLWLHQVFGGIENRDLQVLQYFPSLSIIGLGQGNWNDTALSHLARVPALQELDVSGNSVFTQRGLEQLQISSQLTGLHLNGNQIQAKALSVLQDFPRLEYLSLAGINLANSLDFLDSLLQLRELDLSETNLRDIDLEHLRGLRKLEVLNLGNTCLDGSGLQFLKMTRRLRSFSVGGEETKFDAQQLKYLANNTHLERLSLSCPASTVKNIIPLFSELYDLFLYKATLTLPDLIQISSLPRLRMLSLMSSTLDTRGLRMLSELETLQRLTLSGTNLTDQDIPDVASMQNLEFVSIRRTQVSDDGFQKVKESLHNCIVV